MSVRVMAWVFDQAPTNDPTDQLVLLAIADRCNDDGLEAWPSLVTLAKKTRLCERAVWGSIQRLKAAGVLAVRAGTGRNRSNHYEIIMSPRTTCEVAPGARSQQVPGEPAPDARSPRTTCDPDPAPGANDPSSTSSPSVTSGDPADELRLAWNTSTTAPIPKARELNDSRRRAATARLRDRGLEGMREIFRRINASPFCSGKRGWCATFDWALNPKNITKVLEGNYDGIRLRPEPGRTGAPVAGKYAAVPVRDALERAS